MNRTTSDLLFQWKGRPPFGSVLSLALALALAICLPVRAESYGEMPLGEPMEDFSVTMADGSSFTLSEALKDHDMVLLNFWATWCPPCAFEFPFLQSAYEKYSDRAAVIALSVDPEDTGEMISDYAEEYGLTFPVGSDTDTKLSYTFVKEGIPTSVVIDRFGNIALVEVGAQASEETFCRLFDYFLREDYTKTEILDGIPGEDTAAVYSVCFTGPEGEPVPGCVVNFCTDEFCAPVTSDEKGLARFTGEPKAYHLEILSVPDGYHWKEEEEVYTEERSQNITVYLTMQ